MFLSANPASSLGSLFAAFVGLVLCIAVLVLFGFFIYWVVKFIVFVPKYLKRIAEALEKIADK